MHQFLKYLIALIAAAICLYLVIYICGCSYEEKETDPALALADARAKRDSYVSQLHLAQDDYGFIGTRCDAATFTSLLLAAYPRAGIEIHKVEKEPGKWVRHPERCYEVGDSQSETSLDVYLGVLHWILSVEATDDLEEIIQYGEDYDWCMGMGPEELVCIVGLAPMFYMARKQRAMELFIDDGGVEPIPPLQGFRGHIAALYIHAYGRMVGEIGEAEFQTLKHLAETAPTNPLYQALYHRYADGDQQAAIDLVVNEPDSIPLEVGAWGWGSAPRFLFTFLAVAIMDGTF
jgi:hypothetical protein